MNRDLKIVSPWVNYYREIEALFGKDPDITIEFSNDEKFIKLYITGREKYEALTQLLPTEKVFGNVVLKIELIPSNKLELSKVDLFRRAFSGNPIVNDIISIDKEITGSANDFNYIVFAKEVVQYHDDSLNDPHGNRSTLYQEIAKDVFGEHGGIYFCTDRN